MPNPKRTKSEETPFVELKDISPTLALDWLSAVPDYQRKQDERHVNKIALAIQRGEWEINGAPIVFNEKGDLIDGQHRLAAIARSGKTVKSFVVTGVSSREMAFASLGDSKPRQSSDFIHTNNPHVVAAVLRTLWFEENKLLFYGMKAKGHSSNAPEIKNLITSPPIPEIVKLAAKHAEEIALFVNPMKDAMKVTRTGSWCVFLMYYFHLRRPMEEATKMVEFFARVGDGVGLEPGSPILQLRKRMLDQSPGLAVLPRRVREALLLKAINFYLDGVSIDRLAWSPDREPFPPLRGYDKRSESIPQPIEQKPKEEKGDKK